MLLCFVFVAFFFVWLEIATISKKYLANINFQRQMDAVASAPVSPSIPPHRGGGGAGDGGGALASDTASSCSNAVGTLEATASSSRCPLHQSPRRQQASSPLPLWALTGAERRSGDVTKPRLLKPKPKLKLKRLFHWRTNCFLACALCDRAADRAELY